MAAATTGMAYRITALFMAAALGIPSTPLAQNMGTHSLPEALAEKGAPIEWFKKIKAYCEGPAADPSGVLYWTEQYGKDTLDWPIWKKDPSDPADTGTVVLRKSDQANGLDFDAQGRLVAAQFHKITRWEKDGTATILAESGKGATFEWANDLSLGSDGSGYFTATTEEVYRFDAAGKLTTVWNKSSRTNGIQYVEEKAALYVNESQAGKVTRFTVNPDGTLKDAKTFVDIRWPDGLTVDEQGNFYVIQKIEGHINAYDAAGRKMGEIKINVPASHDVNKGVFGNCSNVAFGGADGKTLFITADGGVYSLKMKVAGRRMPGSVSVRRTSIRLGAPTKGIRPARDFLGRRLGMETGSLPVPRITIPE